MKKKSPKKPAGRFEQLFAKAQINIIHLCPPLCGIVPEKTFSAYQNHGLYLKRSLSLAAQVPRAIVRHWRDKWEKRVVLPRICIIVTTRCTLRCDKCCFHISDLRSHQDLPADELLADIRALLSRVDYIYDFCISGGEPFLHPDLDQVIRACAASGKAGIIKVLTNGTVIPDAKTLRALRDANARVNISDYPDAPHPDRENIKAVLKENKIDHYVLPVDDTYWTDKDSFGPLKAGDPELRYSGCIFRLSYIYMTGQLHPCSPCAALVHDGRIPAREEDFIDLRAADPAAFRAQLKGLQKKKALSACAYCLGNGSEYRVRAGVQRAPHQGRATK